MKKNAKMKTVSRLFKVATSSKNHWVSPLSNYWTLFSLHPLGKAGRKQQDKKEESAVRGEENISGWQKRKCEMVGRKRHGGGDTRRELFQSFPKFWPSLEVKLAAAISWTEDTTCCY